MARGTYIVNLEDEMLPTPGPVLMQNLQPDSATPMPALNAATTHVLVSVDAANVVMTLDGSTPAATTNGHVLPAGYERIFCREAAAAMKPRPKSLQDKAVQAQTDGELFWKISEGREAMPGWKSISEKERWSLVHYVRVLAGKK